MTMRITWARACLGAAIVLPLSGWARAGGAAGPSRYEFTYKIQVHRPEGRFKSLRLWMPLPAENQEQRILGRRIESRTAYSTGTEKKFGNRILYADIDPGETFPLTITATYTIERKQAGGAPAGQPPRSGYWDPARYLDMDMRVPITGVIAEIARQETQGIDEPWEKIRKIYRFVTESMTYSKEGTGWGQGDAVWACSNRRGNCTDFHSLFIGMARSQKIPARFEIGFPIPPAGSGAVQGYHCWARVFSAKKGWVPLDSSEAKKAGKLYEYLGWLPQDRIHFTTGRDIVLEPKQEGPPLNFFIFPYAELDGRTYEGFSNEFKVKTL